MEHKPIRVLYYFPGKETYMDQWQHIHIFNELKAYNITFELFNPLHFTSIEEAWEKLIKKCRENPSQYDLFFTGIGTKFITSDIISEVKKTGIRTLLICFDNLHGPHMHKDIAPLFDLVWLTSHETQYLFKKWGCRTCFYPYAANPDFFKPAISKEIPRVGFIGTPYGTRITKLNVLTQHQIPVSVYSDLLVPKSQNSSKISTKICFKEKLNDVRNQLSFPIGRKIFFSEMKKKFLTDKSQFVLDKNDYLHAEPSVSYEEMNRLFSSFALSLNITDIWNTYLLQKPVFKIHLRTFEIPMSGGIQITNYTPELASYFTEDKEIVFYRSNEEFLDKANFYLQEKNTDLRLKMKQAARKRAELEHTWFLRFSSVFRELGVLP